MLSRDSYPNIGPYPTTTSKKSSIQVINKKSSLGYCIIETKRMIQICKLINKIRGYFMNNKPKYSANNIACFFIEKANKSFIDDNVAEGITNLKLQKLLYFAQAAYCSIYHFPLFFEPIVAWQYGPVVEEVYKKYKKNRNQPIISCEGVQKELDSETMSFLDNIWNVFGKYSTAELVNISHSHKPWMDAYQTKTKNISIDVLDEYYKNYFIV
jgi:uncharacterized phage-associated protein